MTDWQTDGSEREDSRWAQWWASWRVAIRMGRRDVRRHRGRSTLIAVMVALPVLAVLGGVVVISSQQVSGPEALPLMLGHASAMLEVAQGDAFDQQKIVTESDRQQPQPDPVPTRSIPGFGPGQEATALGGLAGGHVARVTSSSERVRVSNQLLSATILGIDVREAPFTEGRARLLDGRWPDTADEVAVTSVGLQHGLPRNGRITLPPPPSDGSPASTGPARTLTIVGLAQGFASSGGLNPTPADLVSLPDAIGSSDPTTGPRSYIGPASVQYLLDRQRPLSSDVVRSLNTFGVRVVNAQFGSATYGSADDAHGGTFAAYTALAAVGLLLLTTLLVGPAFAVSASRQRHTLALVASNGATTPQVRRTVLAQALVLGVLAAVGGAVVGIGGGWGAVSVLAHRQPSDWYGPFDVPVVPAVIVLGSAVVSALAAALLPARGLGRLDVIHVLRGQSVSPRLHRGLPVLGVALVVVGTVLLRWGFVESQSSSTSLATLLIAAGVLVLVTGALCLIPAVMALVGRFTRHLPVTVRMATRDAARQRGRSTPTVAAVMAGSAVLTTLLVVLASTARHGALSYQPYQPTGSLSIQSSAGPLDDNPTAAASNARLVDILRAAAPRLAVSATWQIGDPNLTGPMTRTRLVTALRTGCTIEDAAAGSVNPMGPMGRCLTIGTTYPRQSGILVGDPAYLATTLRLSATEEQALTSGAVLVVDGPGSPARVIESGGGSSSDGGVAGVDVVNGAITLVDTGVETDGAIDETPRLVETRTHRLLAVPLARQRFTALGGTTWGAVISQKKATQLALPMTFNAAMGLDPGGQVDRPTQDAVQIALDREAPGALTNVERGYEPDPAIRLAGLIAVAVAALLVLVATLIATALSQAEALPLMGTLAAVGATRGTRRRIAAAQAGFLAFVGMALGLLVGLVPGIAAAHASTLPNPFDSPQFPPSVVLPWVELITPLVAVPLLAAALAWVSIRRSPTVTRRLT